MPSYESGCMLWEPAPAAALFAIECFRQGRHKRQNSFHIWIVPGLLTGEWRKNVLKSADLIVEIPAGHTYWPADMHESLTLALFFPFIASKPWELRRCKFMVEMESKLQKVLKSGDSSGRSILSELCSTTSSLGTLSIRSLRELLSCKRKS